MACDYPQPCGRRAMQALLALPEPLTRVFCANDLSAFGVLDAAQASGYRVPADFSIVGLDDIDESAASAPPLTTVRQPPRPVGHFAAETLIERLTARSEEAAAASLARWSSAKPPRRPGRPSR